MEEKKVVKFSVDFNKKTVTLYEGYQETVLSENELETLMAIKKLLFKEDK